MFIPVADLQLGEKELEYVTDCIKSNWISSLGGYVTRFEKEFARFCETTYGVSTSNGTTALHLALVVAGIGPGDEVLIPALTFVATANAVVYTGAKPVFVDVEPRTWNMDVSALAEKITSRTRAIIPVHVYGHPVDMDPLLALAHEHNLIVIEDAAEAHGALYKGRRAGSLGDMGCFSFYGNKIITSGEGGMITTNNREYAEKAAWLRDHGMSATKRYWHEAVGFNYRITNIQAAIAVAQLERIDGIIAAKRRNAALYNERLAQVPGLTTPPEAPWATSVYWMYSVLVEPEYGRSRDELAALLRTQGIDSRPFFYPVPEMPPYFDTEWASRFPVSAALSRKGINLPSAPHLTLEQIDLICTALCAGYSGPSQAEEEPLAPFRPEGARCV